jgi:hypothetical protein
MKIIVKSKTFNFEGETAMAEGDVVNAIQIHHLQSLLPLWNLQLL